MSCRLWAVHKFRSYLFGKPFTIVTTLQEDWPDGLYASKNMTFPSYTAGHLVPIPPALAPFHPIGIDLFERFPKSIRENKWIVVSTYYLIRYAITKALPTAEAPEVVKFLLEDIILMHGAPRIIITDRGQVFKSKLISEVNRLWNIFHRMTTAYHAQTNGLTERFNKKTLADMPSMYVGVE
ncbi:hypothetical protein AVEN_28633-1 [Araneus ventricosus]|uniref:Integrase catalytic domain-containing protein n=1 Tax=Araneus ventricosus TaxID=182803 RepID=A0A4Y2FLH1_ARAVE|nr:hypothetical protein AVEN_28633-1 [Araneus ventricosus]